MSGDVADSSPPQAAVAVAVDPATGRTGRRVARNLISTLVTQMVGWGLTYAVTLFLPRYAGDAGLGRLTFALAVVTVCGVFVPLGTSTVVVKGVARDRSRTPELLVGALLVRAPMVGIAALVIAGVSLLLRSDAATIPILWAASAGMVVGTVNDALAAALQGLEQIHRQNAAILADRFLNSAAVIALIALRAPLWAIASVAAVTGFANTVVSLLALRPELAAARRRDARPLLLTPSRATWHELVVGGLPYMGVNVFRTLYGQTDPIVLRTLTNNSVAGWYAAAFRLVGTSLVVPNAVGSAMLPHLARAAHAAAPGEPVGTSAEFVRDARRLFRLLMLFAIPIALFSALLPRQILHLLHYPPAFDPAAPVLAVGGAATLLFFAGMAVGNLVVAADRQAAMFRASVVATVIGIPACALGTLITNRLWHNGAIGAIGSDTLLEMVLVNSFLRALPFQLLDRGEWAWLGRCVVAALPAVAVLWYLGDRGLPGVPALGLWATLPAVGTYVGGAALLGCVDLELLRRCVGYVRNRGGDA
jgi:O-antigen/teichoic acid export membrane protein